MVEEDVKVVLPIRKLTLEENICRLLANVVETILDLEKI